MAETSPDLSLAERIDAVGDQFERDFRAGQQPRLEQFLAAADERLRPALFRTLLELELELRQKAGERPQIAEYETRFPEQIEQIRQAFEAASRPASMVSSVKLTGVDTSKGPVPAKSAVEAAAPSAPKTLGRFEILSVLGEGAFGTVYRARDPQLDREVAVKVPKFAGQQSREDRERFQREARAAANLHHPQICPVHEVGTIDGRDYIVLAFIDGKPLSKVLQSKPQLSDRQIVAVIRKLALALQEAHDKGIIHRDLKPANIMINRKGEPVIMDFGLARRENSGDAQISHSGQIMGTPAYMSPEQARGDGKAVGPASDIYSLGIVLYELHCGRRPFEGTVTEVIGLILHVDAPPPSEFRPTVDPRLQAICLKAIAKKPGDRFASMKDFATALADYVKAAPATARPADAAKAEPESADELHTTQFAQLLAAMSSDVESKVERAVRRAGHPPKTPWWTYLAGSGFMGLVILLGVMFFIKSGDTTVIVQISMEKYIDDLKDPALSFLLDNKPIEAAALESPIELKPGEHELIVNRDGKLFKRFAFNVEIGTSKNEPVPVQDLTPETPESPPAAGVADGWTSLFNGKDLTGWTPESNDVENWKVRDGAITGIADDATPRPGSETWLLTDKEYQDFILRFEFLAMTETVNSGFAYRAVPRERPPAGTGTYPVPTHLQVEIFDNNANRGNQTLKTGTLAASLTPLIAIPSNPASLQLPGNAWNQMEIEARGQAIRVRLNGSELVSGNLDDLIARGATYPGLKRKTGRIGLQRLRGTIQFRNIQIKELKPLDVGWIELFNGKDLSGWQGTREGFEVIDGVLRCKPGSGGVLYTTDEYDDFVVQVDFKLSPGANNGLAIRYPGNGDPAFTGMCEVQLLDTDHPRYANLDPRQVHGSAYGLVAAQRGSLKPAGEWNTQQVTVRGSTVKVELNGVVILDADLATVTQTMGGKEYPGRGRRTGYFGFCGHGDPVEFRNIRIKELGKEHVIQVDGPDRKAAESLLALGGGFVKVNGQDRQIRRVNGLPTEPFRLTGAYFAEVKALDDNGLAVLKDCVHLTELDLRSTRVTEKGLEIFRGKTNFTSLGLAYLRVTDKGLEIFKDNKGLKALFLHDTFLTDKGLGLFHDCKELGTIWVGGTPITDAGVLPFRDCRFLKWLDVRATKVTRDGVRTMKSALPACRVDVDPDKR